MVTRMGWSVDPMYPGVTLGVEGHLANIIIRLTGGRNQPHDHQPNVQHVSKSVSVCAQHTQQSICSIIIYYKCYKK